MSGYLGSGHPWRFPRFSLGAGRDASQNVAAVECSRPDRRGRAPAVGAVSPGVRTLAERFDLEAYSDFSAKWANFRGLVLTCIDAKFCNKIFVGKLLTRSRRFACFCSAQTSIFQKFFVKLFRIFRQFFANFRYLWIIFGDFCSDFDEILSEFRRYFRKINVEIFRNFWIF